MENSGLTDPLIWIDCEMTGLDLTKNYIIEIAVIVTDGKLETIIEGPNIIINCSDQVLDAMDEWCTKQHGSSGLTQQVKDSKITLQDAEQQILKFLTEDCHLKNFTCQLAGNSIGEDKKFLQKDMPKLYSFLHYRIVDVSTIKELCRRWLPNVPVYIKKGTHRALDDIKESIEELKHYKKFIFDKALNQ